MSYKPQRDAFDGNPIIDLPDDDRVPILIQYAFILISLGYMLPWTALGSLISYYKYEYSANFYVMIYCAYYLPGLFVALIQYNFDETIDAHVGSQRSYLVRGVVCYCLMAMCLFNLTWNASEWGMVLAFLTLGVCGWLLHGTASMLAAMFPKAVIAFLQIGFRCPEIFVFVIDAVLHLGKHATGIHLYIFYVLNALVVILALLTWVIVVNSPVAGIYFDEKDEHILVARSSRASSRASSRSQLVGLESGTHYYQYQHDGDGHADCEEFGTEEDDPLLPATSISTPLPGGYNKNNKGRTESGSGNSSSRRNSSCSGSNSNSSSSSYVEQRYTYQSLSHVQSNADIAHLNNNSRVIDDNNTVLGWDGRLGAWFPGGNLTDSAYYYIEDEDEDEGWTAVRQVKYSNSRKSGLNAAAVWKTCGDALLCRCCSCRTDTLDRERARSSSSNSFNSSSNNSHHTIATSRSSSSDDNQHDNIGELKASRSIKQHMRLYDSLTCEAQCVRCYASFSQYFDNEETLRIMPLSLALMLVMWASIFQAAFFAYVKSPQGWSIEEVLYFVRLFSDLLGRPLTFLFRPSFLQTNNQLLTAAILRTLLLSMFFIYTFVPSCPRNDYFIIAFVALYSVASGYLSVLIYEYAARDNGESKAGRAHATNILNMSFQLAAFLAVTMSVGLTSSGIISS